MASQKAVQATSFDRELVKSGQRNIELHTIHVPEPADGEVLIRITLRPVNPTDLISSSGGYGPRPLPFTVGSEGVGVVDKSGPGASKFKKGQRVVSGGQWGSGTWQQYITVAEDKLLAVPDNVNDKTAAQFFVNPVTVLGLVELSDVPQGKYLLQSAAGSVLGRQLIQYAKHIGIKTINVVRRQEQIAELKALGADEVIDMSTEDVPARVKDITNGEGAWAAVDAVGGDFTGKLAQSVRKDGHVRVYGRLSSRTVNVSVVDLISSGAYVSGFILPMWLARVGPENAQHRKQEALRLLADGVMAPLSGRSYDLEQFHEAIEASQQAGRGAKIFLSG